MRVLTLLIAATSVAFLPSSASAAWECSAPGLVSASYDGKSSAYVHLQGYGRGNSYTVTKSSNGKHATGTTGNGTRFTCRKK